jgi:hypothetical protein
MTPLLEAQIFFSRRTGDLYNWLWANEYEFTYGEALRSPLQATANANSGIGISDSNHIRRLAIDICLFKNGVYLSDTPSYEPLGIYWESLSTTDHPLAWGGRFERADGNHFSHKWGLVS